MDSSITELVNFLYQNESYAGACGRLLNFNGTQQIGFNFRRLPNYWGIIPAVSYTCSEKSSQKTLLLGCRL